VWIDRGEPLSACASYPTAQHQRAVREEEVVFAARPEVEAVLLTCSCARGMATADSWLDVAILVPPEMLAVRRAKLGRDLYQAYCE